MSWKDALLKIAPTVATALGGPLAGMAVEALGGVLGGDPEAIKRTVERGQLTGEQLAALKQAELDLKQKEMDMEFKFADLEVRDREGARSRDVELAKSGKKNYRADAMFVLAVAVICGLVWLIWKDPTINEFMKGVFTLVLGRFLGYLDNIYSFEFGSTRSAKTKDETINQLSNR